MGTEDNKDAAKLIFSSSEKGLFGLLDTERITYEEFEAWKKNYLDYNKKIGLPNEPVKVYFDRQQVLDALEGPPNFLTFMFDCNESDLYEGMRAVMCSMNEKGKPIPKGAVFESYPLGGAANTPGDESKFNKAQKVFKDRLRKYKDSTNWGGVTHEDPTILKTWLSQQSFPRVVIYFGYINHYTVMIAGSTKDYQDLVPVRSTDDYSVYDNGTQCCQ